MEFCCDARSIKGRWTVAATWEIGSG